LDVFACGLGGLVFVVMGGGGGGGGRLAVEVSETAFYEQKCFSFSKYCFILHTHSHVRRIGKLLHVFLNVPKMLVSFVVTEVFQKEEGALRYP